MKKMYKNDLESAWKVVYGEWLEISEAINNIQVPEPNPESLIMKDQAFKALSKEAKQVISITIKMTENDRQRPNKRQVLEAMKKVSFNSPFIAKEAVGEVSKWVSQL